MKKFLSYYRPHRGVVVADLACAVLIAATALALPLSANSVVKRLGQAVDGHAILGEIQFIGAAMLALLAAQALRTLFVRYPSFPITGRMTLPSRRLSSSAR